MNRERERELLQALREGSAAAGAELYRIHLRPALGFAVREVRDAHRAEDLVSDAFTRTLSALRSGAGPRDDLARYLRTAIRRLAWSSAHDRARILFVEDIEAYAADHDRAAGGLRSSDTEEAVAEAFLRLRPRHRLVLALRVLDSYGGRRSASVLGVTPAAEAQLYRRARLALRAQLSSSPPADRVSSSGTPVPDERNRHDRRRQRQREPDEQRHLPDAG